MTEFTSPISALLGVVIGHFLASFRDGSKRRTDFRFTIAPILVLLDKQETPDGKLVEFHQKSRMSVLCECAKIEGDIHFWKQGRFRHALADYQSIDEKRILNFDAETAMKVMFPKDSDPPITGKTVDLEKGRQDLKEALQELIDCAK